MKGYRYTLTDCVNHIRQSLFNLIFGNSELSSIFDHLLWSSGHHTILDLITISPLNTLSESLVRPTLIQKLEQRLLASHTNTSRHLLSRKEESPTKPVIMHSRLSQTLSHNGR